jgi:hypothetical protein
MERSGTPGIGQPCGQASQELTTEVLKPLEGRCLQRLQRLVQPLALTARTTISRTFQSGPSRSRGERAHYQSVYSLKSSED